MKKRNKLKLLIMSLLCSACTTYTIPVNSFKEQLVNNKPENLKEVEVSNPLLGSAKNITYQANQIEELLVVDKSGASYYLKNSPSIEMRITLNTGKKKILYFDTVYLENDSLKGSNSRFLQTYKTFALKDIVKIEVQDGGKKFNYKN